MTNQGELDLSAGDLSSKEAKKIALQLAEESARLKWKNRIMIGAVFTSVFLIASLLWYVFWATKAKTVNNSVVIVFGTLSALVGLNLLKLVSPKTPNEPKDATAPPLIQVCQEITDLLKKLADHKDT